MIILRNKLFSGWEQREFSRSISDREVEAFMAKRDPNFAKKVSGVISRKVGESNEAMSKIKQGIHIATADPTAEGRRTLAAWGDFSKTNFDGADIGRNRRAMDEVINTTSGINEKINKKRGKGMSKFHSVERNSRIDATINSSKNSEILQKIGERERKAALDNVKVKLTPKEEWINAGLKPVTKPTNPVSNTFGSTTASASSKSMKTATSKSLGPVKAKLAGAKGILKNAIIGKRSRLAKNLGKGAAGVALAGGALYGASELL